MIKKLVIKNFKSFQDFTLLFGDKINIIVGDNEAGKSTILEAINLALTRRLNGKQIEQELNPHLFNKDCAEVYLNSIRSRKSQHLQPPPQILIEVYLEDLTGELASFRGTMNSPMEDAIGVKIQIVFDEEYAREYKELVLNESEQARVIPTEYYKVLWTSFAGSPISSRGLPVKISYIDAATIRLQSGTDYYLQDIIKTELDPKERAGLSVAYRKLKEDFSQDVAIAGINSKFKGKSGAITNKDFSIALDISSRTSWENVIVPHIDQLPFQYSGKGEQSALKIMLSLERKAAEVNAILIEEPENHLSYSSMNILIKRIQEKCSDKQILITTHSAFVLNKLGLNHLIFLKKGITSSLAALPRGTQEYFQKLPGYDTLRLILAKKTILVEGPSDELIVQKAYLDTHQRLPIENGVDVISVGGLSFARFLDIAKELNNQVYVITDNDGDHKKVDTKYAEYISDTIRVFRSDDDSLSTLEPQLVNSIGVSKLNELFGKSLSKSALIKFMTDNKTDTALQIFDTNEKLTFPQYVLDAIA